MVKTRSKKNLITESFANIHKKTVKQFKIEVLEYRAPAHQELNRAILEAVVKDAQDIRFVVNKRDIFVAEMNTGDGNWRRVRFIPRRLRASVVSALKIRANVDIHVHNRIQFGPITGFDIQGVTALNRIVWMVFFTPSGDGGQDVYIATV